MSPRIYQNTILLALSAGAIALLIVPKVGVVLLAGILLGSMVALAVMARSAKGKRVLESISTLAIALPLILTLFILARQGVFASFAKNEGWTTYVQQTEHRRYWSNRPVIAPSVIAMSHPQRLYVQTDGYDGELKLKIGKTSLEAVLLGEGLFYVDYDPAKHGSPSVDENDQAQLTVLYGSGKKRDIVLDVRRSKISPTWISADEQQGIGVTSSFSTDQLVAFSRAGVSKIWSTGDGPVDARLDPFRKMTAWVLHGNTPELRQMNLQDGSTLSTIGIVRDARRLALSRDGKWAAISFEGIESGIQLVNLETETSDPPFVLNCVPEWVVFGRDSTELVISVARDQSIRRLKIVDQKLVQEKHLELGRPARFLIGGHDGESVFLTSSGYSSNPDSLKKGNHLIQHKILKISLENWSVDSVIETSASTGNQLASMGRDAGLDPVGLDISTYGTSVLAAFSGSGEIATVDPDRAVPLEFDSLTQYGLFNLHGIGSLGEGYVAVADPIAGAIAIRQPKLNGQSNWNVYRLGGQTHPGESYFYRATRGGFSCHSCHLNGDSDFTEHNLGGASGVTAFSKGMDRSAPYFRFAYPGIHYNRIADVHSELAMGQLFGYQQPAPEDVSLLVEDWMIKTPRPENPHWRTMDQEAIRRGFTHFQKAGCAVCHTPPLFSNGSQHLESWLFKPKVRARDPEPLLDVPSLLQTWRQPGYFHHRRFDLDTVFKISIPPNRHGDVSQLSESELNDLKTFLMSL